MTDPTWSPLHKRKDMPDTAWIAINHRQDSSEIQDRANTKAKKRVNKIIPN